MARYLVERTFPEGLIIPPNDDGATIVRGIVDAYAGDGVTWVHSYVSEDKRTTYCVFESPNPEAIRRVSEANDFPVDRILKVGMLDPYPYR